MYLGSFKGAVQLKQQKVCLHGLANIYEFEGHNRDKLDEK